MKKKFNDHLSYFIACHIEINLRCANIYTVVNCKITFKKWFQKYKYLLIMLSIKFQNTNFKKLHILQCQREIYKTVLIIFFQILTFTSVFSLTFY